MTGITHLFTSRRPEFYGALVKKPAHGRTDPRAPRVKHVRPSRPR